MAGERELKERQARYTRGDCWRKRGEGGCLRNSSGCCKKITQARAPKQQTFILYNFGDRSPRSGHQQSQVLGEGPLPALHGAKFSLCPHRVERQTTTSMTSFELDSLPRALTPNTITLRICASTCEFGSGGHKH